MSDEEVTTEAAEEAPAEPEGEEAPVGDYPEIENEVRSEEETAEAENRAPAEPSPGTEEAAEAEPEED